jgi:hypothetical protein
VLLMERGGLKMGVVPGIAIVGVHAATVAIIIIVVVVVVVASSSGRGVDGGRSGGGGEVPLTVGLAVGSHSSRSMGAVCMCCWSLSIKIGRLLLLFWLSEAERRGREGTRVEMCAGRDWSSPAEKKGRRCKSSRGCYKSRPNE